MRRLFFGLSPEPDALDWFASRLEELRSTIVHQSVRWTRVDKVHLTLAFLGHRPEAEIESLSAIGLQVASSVPAFRTQVQGIGGFPHLQRPKVIWLGADPSEPIAALANSLHRALNLANEDHVAHFTVGRVAPGSPAVGRMVQDFATAHPWAPFELSISSLHLVESLPSGEYATIATFPLASEDRKDAN